jgi:hypothetical protein
VPFLVYCNDFFFSVPDPWRFDVDPGPQIRTSGLRIRILLFFSVVFSRCQQRKTFTSVFNYKVNIGAEFKVFIISVDGGS